MIVSFDGYRSLVSGGLSGLRLPLLGSQLLVPNVLVAELVPFAEPEPLEGAPDWVLGRYSWRGQALPLVAFEQASAWVDGVPPGRWIAVMNALGNREQLRFVALVLQAAPSALRVDESLARSSTAAPGPFDLDIVDIGGQVLHIPDLDTLEQQIIDLDLQL